MSYTAGVLLACAAMALIIGLVHQVWLYTRGRQLLSRRQFILRLVNGLLLLAVIGLMFFGVLYRFTDLRVALLYWAALGLLPVVVIIIAWLDLRELQRYRHQRQAELYQNLADLQREINERRTETKQP